MGQRLQFGDMGRIIKHGFFCLQQGLLEKAEQAGRSVLAEQPSHASAQHLLGLVYLQAGLTDPALEMLQMAVRNDNRQAGFHANLAIALKRKAEQILMPNIDEHSRAAKVQQADVLFNQALRHLDKAVRLQADFTNAHFNRAMLLKECKGMKPALQALKKTVRLAPEMYEAWNEMGKLHLKMGCVDEACSAFLRAAESADNGSKAYSNYLLALNYDVQDAEYVHQKHRQWEMRFGNSEAGSVKHSNSCAAGRRLKIAYVSPDFHFHSVAFFAEALLIGHHRDAFTVYCYSDSRKADAMQMHLRAATDVWRDTANLDDAALAGLIQEDEIDILVDLAGHTSGNRLGVFARRPAPLQVNYIGYPNTTGLTAMTHRITDLLADPPGNEDLYSERLVRLQGGFLAYSPPEIARLMASRGMYPEALENSGEIRLGCFNVLAKLSRETMRVWAEILHALPQAKLVIKNASMLDKAARKRLLCRFKTHGIAAQRLELIGWQASLQDHFNLYHGLDLALDTFPYNGTTTTCEALYMGVRVVTMAGDTHASRVGASLLARVGLESLIARTPDEYVRIVCCLIKNPVCRQSMRAEVHRQTKAMLCDAGRLVDELETSYRTIWKQWCKDQ